MSPEKNPERPSMKIELIGNMWIITVSDGFKYEFDSFDEVADFVYAMAGM